MASNNAHIIDIDSEDFEEAPKALRDAYKALRKVHATQAAELDGVRSKLTSLSIGGVLKDQGYKNPKRVQKDLLDDGVDPLDEEAVTGWLAEFGDDYAKGEVAPPPPVQNEELQQKQAAYEQLAAGGELKSADGMSKWDLAQSEITTEMRGEDIKAIYAKHGI